MNEEGACKTGKMFASYTADRALASKIHKELKTKQNETKPEQKIRKTIKWNNGAWF